MSAPETEPHHPLPASEKARRDELPESVTDERPLGDDAGAKSAGTGESAGGAYPNPHGRTGGAER